MYELCGWEILRGFGFVAVFKLCCWKRSATIRNELVRRLRCGSIPKHDWFFDLFGLCSRLVYGDLWSERLWELREGQLPTIDRRDRLRFMLCWSVCTECRGCTVLGLCQLRCRHVLGPGGKRMLKLRTRYVQHEHGDVDVRRLCHWNVCKYVGSDFLHRLLGWLVSGDFWSVGLRELRARYVIDDRVKRLPCVFCGPLLDDGRQRMQFMRCRLVPIGV